MGSIVSSGVGSGLDVAGLVQKLVQAEGAPKSAAPRRRGSEGAGASSRRSARCARRSRASATPSRRSRDIDKFQGREVTLSTPDFVSGTATASAVPGIYASRGRSSSRRRTSSSRSPVSRGERRSSARARCTITAAASDLRRRHRRDEQHVGGIAAAINESAAGAKVLATVVTGARRSAADAHGARHRSGERDHRHAERRRRRPRRARLSPARRAHTSSQPALDAQALHRRHRRSRARTNTISGAIAGVDITLARGRTTIGETTRVTVGYDRAAARKTIDELVKSYNAVVDAIKSVSSYNVETQRRRAACSATPAFATSSTSCAAS